MFSKDDPSCRLCLAGDKTVLVKIFENEQNEPTVTESAIHLKIRSAFKCEVEKSDNLPKYVCRECVQKLDFIVQYNAWFEEICHQVSHIRSTLDAFYENNCCDDEDMKELLTLLPRKRITNAEKMMLVSRALSCLIQSSGVDTTEINRNRCPTSESCQGTSPLPTAVNSIGPPGNFLTDEGDPPISSSGSEKNDVADGESTLSTVKESQSCGVANVTRPLELLTCPECQKPFKKRALLCKHLMSHEGAKDKYQCQTCKKIYLSTSELNRHTRVHMGLKPYECTKCSQSFSQKNLLDNHMNSHEGLKGHLCDICGHSFSSKSNLGTHIRHVHSAEKKKPFECNVCGKCFSRKHHLENHLTTHSKSRAHQCSVCGITFTRFSQLQEHENVHTSLKRFKCSDCDKSFRTKRVLNVHKLLHLGLKPHQCAICKKTFTRHGGLQAHLKTHKV